MAGDEAGTLAALRSYREQLIEPEVAAHSALGDGDGVAAHVGERGRSAEPGEHDEARLRRTSVRGNCC
jgi:hypothetical protein